MNRLNRLEYLKLSMLVAGLSNFLQSILVLAVLRFAYALTPLGRWIGTAYIGTLALVFLAVIVYYCGVLAARLHDFDKSSWYIVFIFIPGVNVLFALWLLIVAGTPGTNSYGFSSVRRLPLSVLVIVFTAAIGCAMYAERVLSQPKNRLAIEMLHNIHLKL